MSNDDTKQKIAQIIRAYFDNRGWGLEATCDAVMKVCEEDASGDGDTPSGLSSSNIIWRTNILPSEGANVALSVNYGKSGLRGDAFFKVWNNNLDPTRMYLYEHPTSKTSLLAFKML